MISFGEGTGTIFDLVCPPSADSTNCVRTVLQPSRCSSHSQDLGVRCESYNEACAAEIKEALSSLTTAIPRECPPIQPPTSPTEAMPCPTHCNIESIPCPTQTTTIEITPEQCPPTSAMPVQCNTHSNIGSTKETTTTTQTEATEANGGITNTLNSSTNDSLLGAFLGLLGVTLAVVLTGWIVTCVYLQRKINRYKLKTNYCVKLLSCMHVYITTAKA